MKLISIFLLGILCVSCSSKPSDEMGQLGQMVLKEDQGLRIEFNPIPMEKK